MERKFTCNNIDNFIKTCLLTLLNENDGYGYSLLEDLEGFEVETKSLNIGSLYRVLRKMESEKLVQTKWEQGQGPKRRVYTITDNGKKELSYMLTIITQKKKGLELILERNGIIG